MYRKYLLWKAFFKQDILYTLFAVVLSGKGVYNTGWMAICDWTMIVITIFIFAPVGYFSFRNERTRFAIAWMMSFPITWTYLGAMWAWQYLYFTDHEEWSSKVLGVVFSVAGLIAAICHTVLFVLSIKVVKNFGKGLKQFSYTTKSMAPKKYVKGESLYYDYDGIDDEEDGTDPTNSMSGSTNHIGSDDDSLSIYDVLRNTYAFSSTHTNNQSNS